MFKKILTLLFLLFYSGLYAQNGYWQQRVNYKINVTLDDTIHVLHGNIEMEYTNNSPDRLEFIYMHLWPNAYLNNRTPFAKQQLMNGSSRFYFALMEEKGFIDSLDFEVNGEKTEITGEIPNYDIVKLLLNKPLEPGQSIKIYTPFRVMIPESFSRMGHVEQSYQITQWYPKPAVYDQKGWHPISYLDQGEFYSEYGDFEVNITVPDNYVVAATGNLQTASELAWLTQKAEVAERITEFEKKSPVVPSSRTYKTLKYTESNVHDFAWFANKTYNVKKGSIKLPYSGREVSSWIYFTNENAKIWKDAINYVNDATYYYSKWVGDYPYQNVSAVDGALSAGGGMEYPTITVIGPTGSAQGLDNVITHEVGHNWFYGILGSNERDYAWMDEGVNSFYENRYMYMKYPPVDSTTGKKENLTLLKFIAGGDFETRDLVKLGYLYLAGSHLDQPCQLASDDYTTINYGAVVYGKSALMLAYLENYLGTERFDNFMQEYYRRWQFKHPQPSDIKAVAEEITGENLSWFFDKQLTTTAKIDFALKKYSYNSGTSTIKVRNRSKIASPVSVSLFKNGSLLKTVWTKPFTGTNEIKIDSTEKADKVIIDSEAVIPEFNRNNNILKTKGPFKKIEPLKIGLLAGIEREDKSTLYVFPAFGGNTTDKMMLGIGMYNKIIPDSRFQYTFVPMYSVGRKSLSGLADINFKIHPLKTIREIKVYNHFSSFAGYTKVEPKITVRFMERSLQKSASHYVGMYYTFIQVDQSLLPIYEKEYGILSAYYNVSKSDAVKAWDFNTTIRNKQSDFTLLETTLNIKYKYVKNNDLLVRVYGGQYINNNNVAAPYRLTFGNSPDYLMQSVFFDRAGVSDFVTGFRHQTDLKQGGFKAQALDTLGNIASTNQGIASVNFQFDIPKTVFALYYDNGLLLGNYPKRTARYYYGIGFTLRVVKNIFEIYTPVFGSAYVRETPAGVKDFLHHTRFVLNLNELKPAKLAEMLF